MIVSKLLRSDGIMRFRAAVAALRARYDVFYRQDRLERRLKDIEDNLYYEIESCAAWRPKVLGLEETLREVIDNRRSLARYGDGEFELMAGRNMSFELANDGMGERLRNVLINPLPNCLNCVPNIFGPLGQYRSSDVKFWRHAALWMRPILKGCIDECESRTGTGTVVLGDTQVSRPYLGVGCGEHAEKLFGLWKELTVGKRILIVEGRYTRLGVGNDLFDGASSLRRIWCPPKGAYAHYDKILAAIKRHANEADLVLLALGATATLLAYDLAKEGVWAVDVGHLDVEYMWMKMGVQEKSPIAGRYVNECAKGHEMLAVEGEAERLEVVERIGC